MSSDAPTRFNISEELIDTYLKGLLHSGVKQNAVDKYRSPIKDLNIWAGEDKLINSNRLKEWRNNVEGRGYSKHTVQTYVATVNTFLRGIGYEALCIPKPIRNDLRNKTFGYLTAIEPLDKRHRKDIVWRCRCKCGKEIEVPATLLINMNTTSCGCLNIEILQHNNRYVGGTELRQSLLDNPISTRAASGYTGVTGKNGKWRATIVYKKKCYYLGTYSKLEDAVKARANAKQLIMEDAQQLYEETDHLFSKRPKRPPKPKREKSITPKRDVVTQAKRNDNTSGYPGVTIGYGKWVAKIAYKKVRYGLGSHDQLEDAVAARKKAEGYIAAGDIDKLIEMSTSITHY